MICSYAAICFDCKDTNSNRRTLKIACKRLNFNYFKERLVHFNGTVVIQGNLNSGFCEDFKKRADEWKKYAKVIVLPESIYEGYLVDNKDKLQTLEKELKKIGIPYFTHIDAFSYSYDKIFMAPDHITGAAVVENSGRVGHLLKSIIVKEQ